MTISIRVSREKDCFFHTEKREFTQAKDLQPPLHFDTLFFSRHRHACKITNIYFLALHWWSLIYKIPEFNLSYSGWKEDSRYMTNSQWENLNICQTLTLVNTKNLISFIWSLQVSLSVKKKEKLGIWRTRCYFMQWIQIGLLSCKRCQCWQSWLKNSK